MEEYSILAYSTLPLGGGVECLVMTTVGLLTFYIKYPLTYISKEAQLINQHVNTQTLITV